MSVELSAFLHDFAVMLHDRAKEAQELCRNAKEGSAGEAAIGFDCGRAMGYYEVLSLLINQSRVFDVHKQVDVLAQIEPDKLLG